MFRHLTASTIGAIDLFLARVANLFRIFLYFCSFRTFTTRFLSPCQPQRVCLYNCDMKCTSHVFLPLFLRLNFFVGNIFVIFLDMAENLSSNEFGILTSGNLTTPKKKVLKRCLLNFLLKKDN